MATKAILSESNPWLASLLWLAMGAANRATAVNNVVALLPFRLSQYPINHQIRINISHFLVEGKVMQQEPKKLRRSYFPTEEYG
jgi:hypothetical protein